MKIYSLWLNNIIAETPPAAAYDSIADWYDALVRADTFAGDVVLPSLFALAGDVRGLALCDLACGQGRVARALAQCGAQVVGVDMAAALVAIAARDEAAAPRGIRYVVDDATTLTSLDDAEFDGVLCNLALMDIADLAAVFVAVRRVLRPGGWFVFSITHPCFEAPHARWNEHADGSASREIVEYFTEGFWRSEYALGVRGQVGAQHRTLATYINALARAGLAIECMLEPQPAGDTGKRVPSFLLMRCVSQVNDRIGKQFSLISI